MSKWAQRIGIQEPRACKPAPKLMKSSDRTPGTPLPVIARVLLSITAALLLLTSLLFQSKLPVATVSANQSSLANSGYVGSKVCSKCHPSFYETFLHTDMCRSMSEITPAFLERIPTSANVFDPKLNRHFEIFARHRSLYHSQHENAADAEEIFLEP